MKRVFIVVEEELAPFIEPGDIVSGPFNVATKADIELANFRDSSLDGCDDIMPESIVTERDERGGFWIMAWHYISDEETDR